eukprot:CAMPEP_0179890046 /NCGR_PEP_ID=MMETSP0982-20121206/32893_1 /TAXON_ID=483367 /ORGANISM="non described non described, Strain CCMP 2436" /LENGTH=187 /DNA_ID=CAMNT_0021786243 /DNA_START=455 /DNA_END=1020 /DNA_ORIENTATION=+
MVQDQRGPKMEFQPSGGSDFHVREGRPSLNENLTLPGPEFHSGDSNSARPELSARGASRQRSGQLMAQGVIQKERAATPVEDLVDTQQGRPRANRADDTTNSVPIKVCVAVGVSQSDPVVEAALHLRAPRAQLLEVRGRVPRVPRRYPRGRRILDDNGMHGAKDDGTECGGEGDADKRAPTDRVTRA